MASGWAVANGAQQTFGILTFGGDGNDRITGVAFDGSDQTIVVTGFFSETVNFNPRGMASFATSAGGTDIFVAKYRFIAPDNPTPHLSWLYTTGTSGDDSGGGVALGPKGQVYVTGWKRAPAGSRDIWIAKLQEPYAPPPMPYALNAAWAYTYAGDGEDAGLGIDVDGIGRVLVTGVFGYEYPGPLDTQEYCLDFNPSAGVDWHCTGGGAHNIFVTRLLPNGQYDWTYTLGGPLNDVGYGIAVDPAYTGRIAHVGWFGDPVAPPGYGVDFDSRPTSQLVGTSTGHADAFCSTLRPVTPTGIKAHLSLVIDNSGSVTVDDYRLLMDTLNQLLANPNVVPQNSTVLVNVVHTAVFEYTGSAVQSMPWTVFTPTTATLFGDHLYNLTRPDPNENLLAEGVKLAADRMVANGVSVGYRNILLIADGIDEEDPFLSTLAMPDARDYAKSVGVDQINAFAVRDRDPPQQYVVRQYMLDDAVESIVPVQANPANPTEDNLGIAAETPRDVSWYPDIGFHDPDFALIFRRLLMRVTVCPGDYNRDGVVNLADQGLFGTHTNNPSLPCTPGDPNYPWWCQYADWNMDSVYGGWDFDRFGVGLGLGCPP